MNGVKFFRRHRGALGAATVLALAAAALVAYAVDTSGYTARHVDLNDGGIWVTDNADGLYGRLNKPVGQLDAGFFPPGGAQSSYTVDIVQEGSAVLAVDKNQGRLYPVDVAAGKALETQAVSVAGDDRVALSGGTAAVLDPTSGKLWAARVSDDDLSGIAALDSAAKPRAVVGAGADLAVADDGTIFAASASSQQLVTIRPTDAGFAKPTVTQLHRQMPGLALSAVGDTPVILDAQGGVVLLPDGRTLQLPNGVAGTHVVLQQPGADADAVYVANTSSLIEVPLRGDSAVTLYNGANGTPAQPVVLGDCVHAAWAGAPGTYARSCGGKPAKAQPIPSRQKLSQPVFRVNRGQIILNDLVSGGVWIVDSTVQEVDDWQAIRPPKPKPNSNKPNKPTHQKQPCAQDKPPQVRGQTLGARPGRTTVLHLLDQAADPCGYVLAISAATAADNGASVSVAGDGQTAEVTVPGGVSSDVHFKYTVSDGHGLSTAGDATVQVRSGDANEAPALRPGYKPQTYSVVAGGTITIPVVPDWRDFDGDPVILTGATVPQGRAAPTSDGSIAFQAPGKQGTQTIRYQVSDGIGDPVNGTVKVNVLCGCSLNAVPAVAQPDVARAVVGKPLTISPLANDTPGSDPTDPSARLTLAAPLPQPVGASVSTDLAAGTVTITAQHVQTLQLRYQAAFGSAKLSTGRIRVDVVASPRQLLPPVAVPDTAVLRGQQPATVDVLANDFDPNGNVMVVQRAVAADDAGLSIAVLQGHWLRISSTQPVSSGVRLIRYTITDGVSGSVTGQVSVVQLPEPANPSPPVPTDDFATVRAGDEVDVPVIDNDIDPNGQPLTLKPGELVTTPSGLGSAVASGNVVRYAAPPTVSTATQVVVDYVATNASGLPAVGHARITVNPLPQDAAHDQPPTPASVTHSVVAGDEITMTVPWTGVDPDGDSVTVTGIASAPQLGRVLSTGPTTITYQAYPLAAGTDTFSYTVSDRWGLSATAAIRIGVVPPGDPQPPVAVDDHVTAAPGATVHVDVLANDLVAPDDTVTIAPLATTNEVVPPGASLQNDRVVVKAPPATGKPLTVSYAITDGTGGRSMAQVIVDSLPHYDIPPVARDDVAKVAPGATSTTVDVLANDDDSDGPADELRVSHVFAARSQVVNRKVVVPVLPYPQAIAYEVRDKGGATSMAVIHVPSNGDAAPHLRPDAPAIELNAGGSKTIKVADYVVDPAAKPVRLTTTDRIWGSPPDGLAVASKDQTTLVLSAQKNYQGPAEAVFEVTDGTSLSDPRAQKALIALPVQIGKPQPVLRCPSSTLSAVQGGAPLKIDLAIVCHVWLDDPSTIGQVDFTSRWAKQPGGVSLVKNSNSKVTITPGAQAHPGAVGTLKIGVAGSNASANLTVRVVKAPPPVVSPITVRGLKAGDSQSVDLRQYVQSPIQGAKVTALTVGQLSGSHLGARAAGPTITLTAPRGNIHGTMVFNVLVTDVPGAGHDDRHVTARMTVEVLGLPGTPGSPSIQSVTSHTIVVAFTPPAANGAPLDEIAVRDSHGGTHSCPASPCTVGGLTNGQAYTFTVRAHNVVGWGAYSAPSGSGRPDKVPDPVGGVVATAKDQSAAVSWAVGHVDGSRITSYQVQTSPAPSSGQSVTSVSGTSTTVTGLTNGTTYSIRVRAANRQGAGAWGGAAKVIPFGRPPAMAAPTAAGADSADNAEKAITVSWPAADGNGRSISKYTVTQYRNGAAAGTQTATGTSTTFSGLANDGSKYTYTVTATNSGNLASPASAKSNPVTAAAKPAPPSNVSAAPTGATGTIQVKITLGQPHAARIDHLNYSVSNGSSGTWAVSGAPGTTVTKNINNLPDGSDANGPSYTVTISECNEQASLPCSDSVTSGPAHPYGPPNPPTGISSSASGQTISWSWSGGDGNGRNWHYQIHVDGGGWSNVAQRTSYSNQYNWSSTHTLYVRVVNDQGTASGQLSKQQTAGARPRNPSVSWAYSSDRVTFADGKSCTFYKTGGGCPHVVLTAKEFPRTTSCHVVLTGIGAYVGHNQTEDITISVDSNGNGTQEGQGYYGYNAHITVTCGSVASTSGTW